VISSPAMKLKIAFRWQILAFCQNEETILSV
jgi:hypothetical protein